MRVGVAPIYSPRPIPAFTTFLAGLLRQDGHEVFALTCEGSLPTCTNLLFRGYPRWVECLMCRTGGLKSYPLSSYTSLRSDLPALLTTERARELAYSSAVTLSREETDEGFRGPVVSGYQDRLASAVQATHASTVQWIREQRIDAVLFYNGRMDITAGLMAACQDCQVPFVSVERSLVGHGIWLVPNQSCLSLIEFDRMMSEYASVPLTKAQAHLAAGFLARRLTRSSHLEWRVYNTDASGVSWPVPSPRRKVLVLPSSRNELEGNAEWTCPFTDATVWLPRLFREMEIDPAEVVIRAHPIWASKVGARQSSPAEGVWRDFAQAHGCNFIGSPEKASSQDLMSQADMVVLNGSSAALEAGALGKPVVCLGNSQYQSSGIAYQIRREEDWGRLSEVVRRRPDEVIRATLRFAYCVGWRFPQYVPFVRAVKNTDYVYLPGASAAPLVGLIRDGRVPADDAATAGDPAAEDAVVARFQAGQWQEFIQPEPPPPAEQNTVRRRLLYRPIDALRSLLPKGDA